MGGPIGRYRVPATLHALHAGIRYFKDDTGLSELASTSVAVAEIYTVGAQELIEERPRGAPDEPGTTQRRYLES